jgi:hypothetical protein
MGFLGSRLKWHNRGESDASEGKYDPPSSTVDKDAYRSYQDGLWKTRGEMDASSGKWNPPAGGSLATSTSQANREAYIRGHDGADD